MSTFSPAPAVQTGPARPGSKVGPGTLKVRGQTATHYASRVRCNPMGWLLRPMAYHITFGTYGTRLHGDARGTVDRRMNWPGEPIIGSDASWWGQERDRLRYPPVVLTGEQMGHAQASVPDICTRGGWQHHTCAAGPDHVHVVLTCEAEGERVRMWLKRWLGEALSRRWPLPNDATWWAEGGSVKWVWTEDYFDDVYRYVHGQRAASTSRDA